MDTERIKAWQSTLKTKGLYSGDVDGVWGPNTQAAYSAFKGGGAPSSGIGLQQGNAPAPVVVGEGGTAPALPRRPTLSPSVPRNPGLQPGNAPAPVVVGGPVAAPKNKTIGLQAGTQPGAQPGTQPGTPEDILASMPNVDIGGAYDAAAEAYKKALDAALASTRLDTQAQAEALKRQYDAARGQAYANARLGAIGNNEILAAQGLAGNAYSGPTSGMSESSRVAQDVAMRNSVNMNTAQENSGKDALALQLLQAGLANDLEYAQYMAQNLIDKANAELAAQQQRFENSITAKPYAEALARRQGGGYSGGYSGGGGSELIAEDTQGSSGSSGSSGRSRSSGGSGSSGSSGASEGGSFTSAYNTALNSIYQKRGYNEALAALNKYYADGKLSYTGYQQGLAWMQTLGGNSTALPY